MIPRLLLLIATLALVHCSYAQDEETDSYRPMTVERMAELIQRIDEEAVQDGNTWLFHVGTLETILVYDEGADRMRVMIPINEADALPPEELERLLQANFDSALDARYAIANGLLWGVFIHPLSSLTDEDFLLGIGQTANVVTSFGTSYSSGMFIYGGGDTESIEQQKLLDDLLKEST